MKTNELNLNELSYTEMVETEGGIAVGVAVVATIVLLLLANTAS